VRHAFLRRISIFSNLDEDYLEKIACLVCQRNYKKGSLIFFEGDTAEAVYFVKKGRVKIYKVGHDGKEHIISILSEGEIFAESCLFGLNRYPASAQAYEDTDVLFIKREDFEELLEENPKIAIEIIKAMGKRLQMVSKKIENLALRDAYGKVAMLLLDILLKEHINVYNGIEIDTQLSRQDMANMVGVTRETFIRALSKLKECGAIDFERDKIKIIDIKKLKEFID